MSHQIAPVNSPILESSDANLASSVVERDVNGDSTFRNVIAEAYLKGAGLKLGKTAAKTSTYALVAATDFFVPFDATSGALTATLPAAASSTNTVFCIKKIDASGNAVTVDGNASETIDGATTVTLAARYDTCFIICDGTGWHIIALSV